MITIDKIELQEHFAEKLKELCKEKGYSTREMASELGMPHITFWEYYKGNRVPSLTCLISIKGRFSDIDLNEFIMPAKEDNSDV